MGQEQETASDASWPALVLFFCRLRYVNSLQPSDAFAGLSTCPKMSLRAGELTALSKPPNWWGVSLPSPGNLPLLFPQPLPLLAFGIEF